MTIFVSIASYRDPQLGPTVQDCIANADSPDDLRFGICWQHAPDEPWPLDDDPRFRVIDIDYRASRGVCWARAQIGHLLGNEDWFLQLDSHHRFAPGWDTKLIAMAENSGSPKPLITTYPTGFTLPDEGRRNPQPWQMSFGRWSPDGIPLFFPQVIPGWKDLTRLLRARFVGACFVFTGSRWAADVPYDPEIYFDGEEISLALRSFTHGYDFFHPPETLVWHEWSRSYRPTHWGDHTAENDAAVSARELQHRSTSKVRNFLRDPHIGELGCGTQRSAADYKDYSGLDFTRCRVQEYTLQDLEPPNPPADPAWPTVARPWQITVVLVCARLEPDFVSVHSSWELSFHDPDGNLIETTQITGRDRARRADRDPCLRITRSFNSAQTPASWTLQARKEHGGRMIVSGAIHGRRRGGSTHHSAHIANRVVRATGK